MTAINGFFVDKDTRICALTLLCEYIGQQPPHLHQMLDTPLFDNILKCLRFDTSTRVISLAMTALVMVLPHIPTLISSAKHLPSLFNIYSRMLFWDRERKIVDGESLKQEPEDSDSSSDDEKSPPCEGEWAKLSYLLESDDETVPELLHYYTFLYGLYPINFMSYIRKPQKYLRSVNYPGADDIEIEASEIRQRSEPFRRVHLLHPNFFNLTIESELTDMNRWMNSQAPDVVAECMELYTDNGTINTETKRTRGPTKKLNLATSAPIRSKHSSWKEIKTPIFEDTSLQRSKSHPTASNARLEDSPTLPAIDSPPVTPGIELSASKTSLGELLNTQRFVAGSVLEDPIPGLQLTDHHDQSIDEYLSFRAEKDVRPSGENVDPAVKIAYLQREIQLLRNDLNFEQFLKAQHLSHIGQLRQKQLRDARVEAETQNLINSNRQLRAKYEETKRLLAQIRKENEKSKTHARKWETDLSNRLRTLKDDQKKWTVEKDGLERDLQTSRNANVELKTLVIKSERKELNARQRLMTLEASIAELDHIKAENVRLNRAVLGYEKEERTAVKATAGEERAVQDALTWKSKLRAKEKELLLTKQAFERELYVAQTQHEDIVSPPPMFDELLATAKNRTREVQQAHQKLQARYNDALHQIMQLKAASGQIVYDDDFDLPLHSPSLRSPSARLSTRKSTATDQSWDKIQAPLTLDTAFGGPSASQSSATTRSPISGGGFGAGMSHMMGVEPFVELHRRPSTKDEEKIKPQSEVRIYGRGGVQNIGKKEKGKEGESKEGKKKEKSSGLRGIRGFG
jgi:solute carrier family 25 protein 16